MRAYEQYETPIIALERVSDKRVSSYGIVETSDATDGAYTVSRFLEKPQPEETPSRL